MVYFLVFDQSSSVGLWVQDYKSLYLAVKICATLVNTQTYSFWPVILIAELKLMYKYIAEREMDVMCVACMLQWQLRSTRQSVRCMTSSLSHGRDVCCMYVAVTVAEHTSICTVYDFTTQPWTWCVLHVCCSDGCGAHINLYGVWLHYSASICSPTSHSPSCISLHLTQWTSRGQQWCQFIQSSVISLNEMNEIAMILSAFENRLRAGLV